MNNTTASCLSGSLEVENVPKTFPRYLLSHLACMCGSNSQHNRACLASTSITAFNGSGLSFLKSKASQGGQSSGEESS